MYIAIALMGESTSATFRENVADLLQMLARATFPHRACDLRLILGANLAVSARRDWTHRQIPTKVEPQVTIKGV